VFEQLVIWYYILVELSLEVQGGQDYFRIVEGTCINCLCSSSVFCSLTLNPLHTKTLNSDQTLNFSDSDPENSVYFCKKETFLKTQFNPPFLCFSHLHSWIKSTQQRLLWQHVVSTKTTAITRHFILK